MEARGRHESIIALMSVTAATVALVGLVAPLGEWLTSSADSHSESPSLACRC
jgi:hypothetical protein